MRHILWRYIMQVDLSEMYFSLLSVLCYLAILVKTGFSGVSVDMCYKTSKFISQIITFLIWLMYYSCEVWHITRIQKTATLAFTHVGALCGSTRDRSNFKCIHLSHSSATFTCSCSKGHIINYLKRPVSPLRTISCLLNLFPWQQTSNRDTRACALFPDVTLW